MTWIEPATAAVVMASAVNSAAKNRPDFMAYLSCRYEDGADVQRALRGSVGDGGRDGARVRARRLGGLHRADAAVDRVVLVAAGARASGGVGAGRVAPHLRVGGVTIERERHVS